MNAEIISLANVMCKIFNQELKFLKQDLVRSGNGDLITMDIITGAEVTECSINADNEVYIKFKNDDVIKGVI